MLLNLLILSELELTARKAERATIPKKEKPMFASVQPVEKDT